MTDEHITATAVNSEEHEVLQVMAALGWPLSAKLREMLNEHYSHCSERRGCGFTQATRVLSTHVNLPRSPLELDDWQLFDEAVSKPLVWLLAKAAAHGLELQSWRNLDLNPRVDAYLQVAATSSPTDEFTLELKRQVALQQALRQAPAQVERLESRLLVEMIRDLVLPPWLDDGIPELPAMPEKSKVGSCTLAEKFFLEIAHSVLIRKGRINVVVDTQGRPLLLEKVNMGDSHSCLSVVPVRMNGVLLPPGSLFAVEYPEELPADQLRPCSRLKGVIIPLALCTAFRFLRLTTFVVPPAIRARAFGAQYVRQAESGFLAYDSTELSVFAEIAARQVAS